MLRRLYRISSERDINRFFGLAFKKNRGRNFTSPFLLMKGLPGKGVNPRFGFVVSKSIDNRATVRNLIKRRMREAVRLNLGKVKVPVDLLLIAKSPIKNADYKQIEADIFKLFYQARIL